MIARRAREVSGEAAPSPAVVPTPTGEADCRAREVSGEARTEKARNPQPRPPWSRSGAEQPTGHGNCLCQGDQLGFQFRKNHPHARPSLRRGSSGSASTDSSGLASAIATNRRASSQSSAADRSSAQAVMALTLCRTSGAASGRTLGASITTLVSDGQSRHVASPR